MRDNEKKENLQDFYPNKKILITGHTGFKGSWLCKILTGLGADVTGYSLEPPTEPNLFQILNLEKKMKSIKGDVRDLAGMMAVFDEVQPEIVIHLAAQPLVRLSYEAPVETFETNVMGTVNVCECVRTHTCVRSFLNVTTDKVYENKEWEWGYRENDPLDGYDPYSNSKSCSELVTHSYLRSFYQHGKTAVSTARAGNVIGGGDFAADRILPDCVRAALENKTIRVRNPYAVRPFQHVLEPLLVYLLIVQRQYEEKRWEGFYNVGPEEGDCVTTGKLVTLFCEKWQEGLKWESEQKAADAEKHEAGCLKLDCSRLKQVFGWKPVWNIETAVEKTVEWSKVYRDCSLKGDYGDLETCMEAQIQQFLERAAER